MSFRSRGNGRALLPFGLDYSDVLSSNFDIEKAKIVLPINSQLSQKEELIAKQGVAFSKLVLDGPFYTGSSTDPKKVDTSQFSDGIERHSDKYKKVKKVGRTIEEHPYQLEFFPEELYSVMGISSKKRQLELSSYKAGGGLKEFQPNDNDNEANALVEKLRSMADDLDNNEAETKEDDDDVEEELEDEFEDDEDDDYNAEKYFDDGNEDFADNGDDEAAF